MLEPRGTTLTSRPAKFPVGSDAFTCNGRFPINRLQAPINRTGRMMMTSSAAQFHPFTNSNLPPRYSSGAERCGKKKDAAITNHEKMDDARANSIAAVEFRFLTYPPTSSIFWRLKHFGIFF